MADATLVFRYRDRAAALGPLAGTRRPHSYDLCERHAGRTTPPEGWSLVDERPDSAARASDDVAVLAAALGRSADVARLPPSPHQPETGRAEAW